MRSDLKFGSDLAGRNLDLAAEILERLRSAGFEPVVEPTVGGVTPDFAVPLSNGQTALLEAKSWEPTAENLRRAQAHAVYFREHLGAVEALVVLPSSPTEPTQDVVGLSELVTYLEERQERRHRGAATPAPVEPPSPILFCAMPFHGSYDDVFFIAMVTAAEKNRMTARRVDKDEFSGDIVARIHELVDAADLVVADVSGAQPNVMYELGYARGRGKTVIPICSTPVSELPFDIAHNNTIAYEPGRTHRLAEALAARVAAARE